MAKDSQEIYLETRNFLAAAQQLSFQQFDKSILTLSGGGLTLSLFFLRDILQLGPAYWPGLLIASWIFFGVSLLTTLASFLTSQAAYDLRIHELDYIYSGNTLTQEATDKAATITRRLNWASGASFMLAVTCLLVFVSVNFDREGPKMSEQNKVRAQQGQVPPPLNKAVAESGKADLIKGVVPPPLPPAQLFQGAGPGSGPSGSQQGQQSNAGGSTGKK